MKQNRFPILGGMILVGVEAVKNTKNATWNWTIKSMAIDLGPRNYF